MDIQKGMHGFYSYHFGKLSRKECFSLNVELKALW